ncbi:MAG: hypothetical protein AAF802_03670 [Planctomycetota bacterium]
MNRTALVISVAVVGVAASLAFAQQQGAGKSDASLDELLQLREDKLTDVFNRYKHMDSLEGVDFELLNNAHKQLHVAKLETAKTKEQRIELLEDRFKFLKIRADGLRTAIGAGLPNQMTLLLLEVEVVNAEIALARERRSQ